MAESFIIFFGGDTGELVSIHCPGRLKYSMYSSMSRCTRGDQSGLATGIAFDSRFCFNSLSDVKPKIKTGCFSQF